ncbi:hypothetical protein HCN44_002307 [Aphidius gifuensis]|uniref:Large ribosomal subunit protein uL10m n=2 Tax=Aphidius gifuensis TaxID=684658 RepID=A0A834Y522_APHGI|nr:hypothetical protein HCN44_002307 [Aphidius gifuensis]
MFEQKRFRTKINIQKPRIPHFTRRCMEEFVTPYYDPVRPILPVHDLCGNILEKKEKLERKATIHQYEIIIGREVLNWFNNSKMVAFLHKNSMNTESEFEFNVALRRENMYLKYYGIKTMEAGLKGTKYENVLKLWGAPGNIVFSEQPKLDKLLKIMKKTPQVVLMAGILDGVLLNLNDFKKYGTMDLTTAQAGLVQTLRTAGGGDIHAKLNQHQMTFVNRLDQIGESLKDENLPPKETEA